MNDLIRREDVIKLVNQFVFGLCKEQNDEVRRTFNKYIEKMPTAYSVGKVIEEIEKANQGCCNYCGCDLYSDDVIDIVKHGGIETDDMCECRSLKGYKFLHETSCGNFFDMQVEAEQKAYHQILAIKSILEI